MLKSNAGPTPSFAVTRAGSKSSGLNKAHETTTGSESGSGKSKDVGEHHVHLAKESEPPEDHHQLRKKMNTSLPSLLSYIQEVRKVKAFYEANKDNPPILKYHPKVAGRIWWMKSLFYHIKRPIVEFRKLTNLIETEAGQLVWYTPRWLQDVLCCWLLDSSQQPATQQPATILAVQEYLTLARDMRAYGDSLYVEWNENAAQAMPLRLRENVLVARTATEKDLGRNLPVCKNKNVYTINAPNDILEMIQEALHLEQMGGFRISEAVRNVSLQRNQYIANSRALEVVVESYYKLRLQLRPPETQLCDKLFKEIDKHFEQGATHWNWAALGIPEYTNTLKAAVGHFEGVVSQINKIGRDIRFRVLGMKDILLFKEPPYKTASYKLPLVDCWDYFQYWEKHREKAWEKLLLAYRGLPPLFLKLETLIHNSSTGKLKSFRPYFLRWEELIFQYMGKFIIKSLYTYEKRLLENEPLFYVEAVLHARDIRLNPPPHEIFNLVMKGARDCVDGSQKFVRWMRGSCMEAPVVQQGGDEPPFVYSFYLELGRIPRMLQLFLTIQENIQTILSNIWVYLKKFRKFKNLIRFNKDKTVKEFAIVNPSVDLYDDKLGFYSQIERRIGEMTSYKVEGCIKLHMKPLMTALATHANEWVLKLGAALLTSSQELIDEFEIIVSDYDRDIHILPKNMEEMKRVFLTIQAIQDATISVEALYRDLVRRYDVLKLYKIEFSESDVERLETIWKRWQMLWLHEMKLVDKRMQPLKLKFTKITQKDRKYFLEQVKAFVKSYNEEGPGSVDADLDRGVELLGEYREKYKVIEQKRLEMMDLEKLFGLECVLYPELLEIEKDMENLAELFNLYTTQKEAKLAWGQILWSELNPQYLSDRMEEYLQELRGLPRSVRGSEVGKQLERMMKGFKRSIPFYFDLKNESFRERVTLVDKTGVLFDYDPDHLTPGKLFLMEIRFGEKK